MLRQAFGAAGYGVTMLNDGKNAKAAVVTDPGFCPVIVGEGNGAEVPSLVRASQSLRRRTPRLVTVTKPHPRDVARLFDYGANQVVNHDIGVCLVTNAAALG